MPATNGALAVAALTAIVSCSSAPPTPTACGRASCPSPLPVASFPPATDGPLVLDVRPPFTQTVRLQIGQRLDVSLPPDVDPLGIADTSILATESTTGGYPGDAPLMARLVALRLGETRVRSETDASCFHTPPYCTFPQAPFTLRVVVR